jgi:hypothetical protein
MNFALSKLNKKAKKIKIISAAQAILDRVPRIIQ